jgi:hypothetical protein
MENGGDQEHRPWEFDTTNQTLDIYRKFVDIHYQLVPYLLTTGSRAIETGISSIMPVAKHDSFIEKLIDDFKPPIYIQCFVGREHSCCPYYQQFINSQSHVSFQFGLGVLVES